MPKNTNPNRVQNNIGQEPFTQANYRLTVGALSPNNILSVSPAQKHDAGVDFTFMLASHVQDPHAAHPASAISVEDIPPGTFNSDNVQGVLQELAGLSSPFPAGLGEWYGSFPLTTGIPDWGILGMNDGALTGFSLSVIDLPQSHRYPYQWVPPTPGNRTNLSDFGPFEPPPATVSAPPVPPVYFEFTQTSGADLTANWNAGGYSPRDTVFNVADGVGNYNGGGNPTALAGGFTRRGNLVQTYRILRRLPAVTTIPVVATGVISPADRGVVALIHWPDDGLMAQFAAQPLLDKVVAAICLGQGLYDQGGCPVDGEGGGIFLLGGTTNDPDPYAWPGQATGQAGLAEIYRGVADCFSSQTFTDTEGASGLGPDNNIFKQSSPYWNFDGLVSPQLTISATTSLTPFTTQITVNPAHNYKVGQPITVDNCPDINGGAEITATVESIVGVNDFVLWVNGATNAASSGTTQRITGCDVDDYPANETPFPAQVRVGTVAAAGIAPIAGGVPILGAPYLGGAVRGTPIPTAPTTQDDLDNNFFQYRLPVLNDYSNGVTGLKHTPLLEKPRYYAKPPLADNALPLVNAGNFTAYGMDYYPHQIARFRHRFEIAAPSTLTDAGSYILLHFKKEEYFEDLVVRGVWPTDDKLYSANVANVAAINAGTDGLDNSQSSTVQNMIDQTDLQATGWVNGSINGKPFFNLCGTVVVDKTDMAIAPPVLAAAPTYDITTTPAGTIPEWIHTVSGVSYFAARDSSDSPCFELDTFSLTVNRLFGDGLQHRAFLTGNRNGSFSPSRIMTMTPLMTHLGDFFNIAQDFTITTAAAGVWKHSQHAEFAIEAINPASAVGGAGPLIAATATLPVMSISPTSPVPDVFMFSTKAKPHAFVRTPLSHSFTLSTDGVNLVNSSIALLGGASVLYSACTRDPAANPEYGNLVDPFFPPPALPLWPAANFSLFTTQKAYEERFLDEVYRYHVEFGGITVNPDLQNLIGPGLPLPAAPIEIPSKAGVAITFVGPPNYFWENASWFQGGTFGFPAYEADLSAVAYSTIESGQELQVAGLPHRNPPISEGPKAPKPATGMLLYPKTDYTTNHRPDLGTDGVTQFDYRFGFFARNYVRVLDLQDASLNVQPGQPFAILQFKGLTLDDFAYAGGATPGSSNIAILAKVPGLTTWMDVGRVDGAGPSKQDPLLDGAGCAVLGPDTKNLIDPLYGYPIAQVKINVGPVANFFKNVIDGQCEDEIPLLIKVVYYCPHAVATITVRDFNDAVGDTITLNGTGLAVLTEGVDWTAAVSNNATAISIAAAVNTAAVGITAKYLSNVVYLMADVFGTAGAAYTVICGGAAPSGLLPTVLTNFTGGCESDKYDLTYQVTSALGVTPVVFNPASSENYRSAEVRGLYTITAVPLT